MWLLFIAQIFFVKVCDNHFLNSWTCYMCYVFQIFILILKPWFISLYWVWPCPNTMGFPKILSLDLYMFISRLILSSQYWAIVTWVAFDHLGASPYKSYKIFILHVWISYMWILYIVRDISHETFFYKIPSLWWEEEKRKRSSSWRAFFVLSNKFSEDNFNVWLIYIIRKMSHKAFLKYTS